MIVRHTGRCVALGLLCLLAGCHRHAPVVTAAPPPPPTASAGPVMVSVPPPTHHSTDTPGEVATSSSIPVVKPVRPPRKPSRRSQPAATQNPAPNTTAVAAVAQPQAPPTPKATQSLGQLTASTDDPAATRDGAAQAIRRERDRIASMPATTQSAHTAEMEQARRFLKSAVDSWNASDYVAALALSTKTRVLLDDLLK